MTDERDEPIARWLSSTTDEARLHRSWKRVAERRNRPPARVGPRIALAAAALIGIGVVGWMERGPAEPMPLTTADGSGLPATLPRAIELSDGSRIALDEAARVHTVASSGTYVGLWQERGSARFDVTPHGPRRWEVRTPYGVVRVIGTEFTVAVAPGSLSVEVHRGVVEVSSEHLAGGTRRVRAGRRLVVEVPDGASDDAESAASSEPPAEGTTEPAHDDAPIADPAVETAAPSRDAPSVDELFEQADAARREGRPRDAIAPLRAVMRRHDPRASLAAFTLATLELDTLDEPERAARDFQRAIALGLGPQLHEEALARSAIALARAGRAVEARAQAGLYLRRYPSGSQAGAMRALLAP